MDVLTSLTIIGVVTVLGETLIRVSRARAGSTAQLQSRLDRMQQQLDDQATALSGHQAHLTGHGSELSEVQERLDFAERVLTKGPIPPL